MTATSLPSPSWRLQAWPVLWKSRKPAAYWYLGAEALAVAVVRPSDHEPELLACWGVQIGQAPGPLACGVAEAVEAVDAADLRHIVAVDRRYARLLGEADAVAMGDDAGSVAVRVEGRPDLAVLADRDIVNRVVRLFARVGLQIADIDAEDCALASLAAALGSDLAERGPTNARSGGGDGSGRASAGGGPCDALSAVSVDKAVEEEAVRLAELLAVPIGLAVARLGACGDLDEI